MSVESTIRTKLESTFAPEHLDVLNESGNHRVPPGSESHFKVVVVAAAFEGERLIARHRRVNAALATELAGDVHALALHTYTPAEWRARVASAPDSPACAGRRTPP
jgi:BolA family transcriptional regulator, general stress-responsive regulator